MTDFLLTPGTNGFVATPFDLETTELNALANGNTATSSVGGSSGVFTQSSIANAPQGSMWFTSGGSFTPTAGGQILVWFLRSPDGGSTFEKAVSNTAFPRPPDAIIPLFGSAYASGDKSWVSGAIVDLPWESFKVVVMNNSGAALPATGNKVTLGPVALRY